jgi:hypothetical protein
VRWTRVEYRQLHFGKQQVVEVVLLRLQKFDCRNMPSPQGATKEAARIVRNTGKHAAQSPVHGEVFDRCAILTRQFVKGNHYNCARALPVLPTLIASSIFRPVTPPRVTGHKEFNQFARAASQMQCREFWYRPTQKPGQNSSVSSLPGLRYEPPGAVL